MEADIATVASVLTAAAVIVAAAPPPGFVELSFKHAVIFFVEAIPGSPSVHPLNLFTAFIMLHDITFFGIARFAFLSTASKYPDLIDIFGIFDNPDIA
jgi:hypothetical protein